MAGRGGTPEGAPGACSCRVVRRTVPIPGAPMLTAPGGGAHAKAGEVSIPAAVSSFPREIIPVARSWAERAYPNLVYFNKLEKGGHFAAWEQPELSAGEMRAAFRSLR